MGSADYMNNQGADNRVTDPTLNTLDKVEGGSFFAVDNEDMDALMGDGSCDDDSNYKEEMEGQEYDCSPIGSNAMRPGQLFPAPGEAESESKTTSAATNVGASAFALFLCSLLLL